MARYQEAPGEDQEAAEIVLVEPTDPLQELTI